VAELARAGVRVARLRRSLEAGELTVTSEHGVYDTTPAMRTKLLVHMPTHV
jgi:hypothetical protein